MRRTRPYRPQTNGKAERFNRTLLDEWAYSRLYRSNDDRLARLPRWLHAYNSRRPHTALGGSHRWPSSRYRPRCGHPSQGSTPRWLRTRSPTYGRLPTVLSGSEFVSQGAQRRWNPLIGLRADTAPSSTGRRGCAADAASGYFSTNAFRPSRTGPQLFSAIVSAAS